MAERTCSIENCTEATTSRGWCSRHYQRWYRLGDPLAAVLSETAPCLTCGGPVPPKTVVNGPRSPYCSRSCRSRQSYLLQVARGTRKKPPGKPRRVIACVQCGAEFESPRDAARFCSPRCSSAHHRSSGRPCSTAGCVRPHRAKGLCNVCYSRERRAEGVAWKTTQPWNDRQRDAYHRRRALKLAAATGEPVALAKIAERDRWRCGLCGKRVSRSKVWPDPLSPSLDHIVPLTRGGKHDPAYVQLTHFRCNISKGNRGGGEQLMLIG